MLNSVLAWVAVILAAVTFGAFLFGASSALALAGRLLRPRTMTLRLDRRVRASHRLWA